MRAFALAHLSDHDLLHALAALVARDRATTAELLAHIAEVDARRLFLPAGYPSMHAYCVGELRLSEDAASKRIHAARAARQFPSIFAALADGRLHLSAVVLVAPHLNRENASDLLQAAANKTKAEVELMLAQRFPRSEWLPLVQALPAAAAWPNDQHAPGHAGESGAPAPAPLETDSEHAPGHVAHSAPRATLKPQASERYALQLTIGKGTYEKLGYAQSLLSHRVPSGDLAAVLDRALDALINRLEKQKFAATTRPRPGRSSADPRHIPARVKQAVWARDRGQCTFVGENGQRCPARKLLEFDHVDPVARGGRATVENIRLRCRAHNQYEAERTFGAGFMEEKREEARRAAAAARARAAAAPVEHQVHDAPRARVADVTTCLRELGFRSAEVRRAVEFCTTVSHATLEEHVRAALNFLCPKVRVHAPSAPGPAAPA